MRKSQYFSFVVRVDLDDLSFMCNSFLGYSRLPKLDVYCSIVSLATLLDRLGDLNAISSNRLRVWCTGKFREM